MCFLTVGTTTVSITHYGNLNRWRKNDGGQYSVWNYLLTSNLWRCKWNPHRHVHVISSADSTCVLWYWPTLLCAWFFLCNYMPVSTKMQAQIHFQTMIVHKQLSDAAKQKVTDFMTLRRPSTQPWCLPVQRSKNCFTTWLLCWEKQANPLLLRSTISNNFPASSMTF